MYDREEEAEDFADAMQSFFAGCREGGLTLPLLVLAADTQGAVLLAEYAQDGTVAPLPLFDRGMTMGMPVQFFAVDRMGRTASGIFDM